jgi:hypothetical protein
MKKRTLLTLIAMTLLTVLLAGTAAAGTPEERVAAFHQTLMDGDIEGVKGMLAKDVLMFEDGVADTSLKKYAKGHLKADIAFMENAKRKVESQASWIDDDTAIVSSTYGVNTRYRRQRYLLKSAETMVLKLIDDQWIIVHVHWSNYHVKEQ